MPATIAVTFPGALGNTLSGRLHFPAGVPSAFAIFAHCFTCTKNIKAAVTISRALAQHGIASLRFDFTGLGESEGDFAESSFSSNMGDLVAAADWLREHHQAPSILVGHSLGGAAVLAAAAAIPEAKAVATIGAPADPAHVRGLFEDSADTIEAEGEAMVKLAGRPFRIKKQFLDDLATQCSSERIAALKRSLLVFHSPQDNLVGIENARRIFQAARHPKSFVSLDGADHLLMNPADAGYVGSVLASWAQRYLPVDERDGAEEGPRRVDVSGGREKYRNSVRVGPHALVADEPASLGGSDTGPSPYDLLLAGLGACTSMTLRMYADRKKWPLDEVKVSLSHKKIHAKDCDECETATGKLDDIEREVTITGDLDAEQRARLIEIADKCPVHRTLHNEVRVRTKLVD
jgi:uncharacterized OsmC-like protein/alpha/beta superfamily hydrolase